MLLQGHGNDALVSTVSTEGSAAGVVPGMTAAEARRRSPRATFLADNSGECLDVLEHLGSIISTKATPFVALGGRDHLFITVSRENVPDNGSVASVATVAQLARLAKSWSEFNVVVGVGADEQSARLAAQASTSRALRCSSAQVEGRAVSLADSQQPIVGSTRLSETSTLAERRAAVVRLVHRMDALVEGRGESFRDVEVTLAGRRFSSQPRQPLHSFADILPLMAGGAFDEALAEAEEITVRLGRRGPDVRVRAVNGAPRQLSAVRQPMLQAS